MKRSIRNRSVPLPVLWRLYRKPIIFLLAGIAWLVFVKFFITQDNFNLLAIPVLLTMAVLAVENFRSYWYILVFGLPFSFTLGGMVEGANITFPSDLIALSLLVLMAVKMVSEKIYRFRFFQHPIFWLLCVWLFWAFFTSMSSQIPLVSFKYVAAMFWLTVAFYMCSVLVFHQLRNVVHFFTLIAMAFAGVICIVLFLYVSSGRNPFALRFNPMPFFNDHTVLGAFAATLVPIFVLFTFQGRFRLNTRIVMGVLLFFVILGLFFSYSRGAWASTLLGLALMTLFMLRGIIYRFLLPLTVAAIIGGIFVYQNYQSTQLMKTDAVSRKGSFYDHFASISNWETDDSNAERINRWMCAWFMWQDHPWLGHGPGTYAMIYPNYQQIWWRTLVSTNRGDNGTAHQEFLLALSEQGIIGSVIMVFFFLVPIGFGIRGYLRATTHNVRLIYLGCATGIFIYFVHSFVNNFLDQDKIGGTLLGMYAVITALDIYHLHDSHARQRAYPRKPLREGA